MDHTTLVSVPAPGLLRLDPVQHAAVVRMSSRDNFVSQCATECGRSLCFAVVMQTI